MFQKQAGELRPNGMGFFSMPVLENDEIIISSVGYNRQYFTVPPNSKEYETICCHDGPGYYLFAGSDYHVVPHRRSFSNKPFLPSTFQWTTV
jgi:hypothetical protein